MVLKAIVVAWLLLFLGDFFSTFCYHVPEHVFGTLHLRTHHASKKEFRHYAVLAPQINVLLDGILGALPYLLIAIILWPVSPIGVLGGLLFGQFHVWWRHTTVLAWLTPKPIDLLCQIFFITTPNGTGCIIRRRISVLVIFLPVLINPLKSGCAGCGC